MISNIGHNYLLPLISSTPIVIASRCISALPAIEIALCGLKDGRDLFNTTLQKDINSPANESVKIKRSKHRDELIGHLVIAILLGGCTLNVVPYSCFIGALSFLTYSKCTYKNEIQKANPSNAIVITGLALTLLSIYKKNIIGLTVKTIQQIAKTALRAIKQIFKPFKALEKGISKCIVTPLTFIVKNVHKICCLAIKNVQISLRFMIHNRLCFK